ncbi:MAG: 50S ribosomal protein L1 [Parcubacteria group bacterium]|nr:50S ribosomal protein L1 [Parcubacteria group bacterium]
MTQKIMEFDKNKTYSSEEAIKLVKEMSKEKFDASIEVHFNLGINPKKTDQSIRGTIKLPHSAGKSKKIAAFVGPDKEKEAKDAGADLVGGEELVAEVVKSGKCDFDVAVATPDMMPKLAKAAKILGPKGLMPNPKTDTVGTDIKKMVEDLKGGKMAFKNDDTANVHQIIGKVSMEDKILLENFNAFLSAIKKAKPSGAKGTYMKKVILCSTMGKGVLVTV